MRVRLTRKLAEHIDGVDLTQHRVGDYLELPPSEARLLIAEAWATDEERRRRRTAWCGADRRDAEAQPSARTDRFQQAS
jgi:hypothetical protein